VRENKGPSFLGMGIRSSLIFTCFFSLSTIHDIIAALYA